MLSAGPGQEQGHKGAEVEPVTLSPNPTSDTVLPSQCSYKVLLRFQQLICPEPRPNVVLSFLPSKASISLGTKEAVLGEC